MTRSIQNTAFTCINCLERVQPLTNGSYRNHCPFCLYSLHVDQKPGDRANTCRGLMQPFGLVYKSKKGWQIIHQCTKCNIQKANKVATNTLQNDDYKMIASLYHHIIKN